MIVAEIRGRKKSLRQVRNGLAQTGGLHGPQKFTCHLLTQIFHQGAIGSREAAVNKQISIQKDSRPSEFSRPLTPFTLN